MENDETKQDAIVPQEAQNTGILAQVQAETQALEQARTMWESDRQAYGLPEDASVKFEKQ
jgi:hypothetical protein